MYTHYFAVFLLIGLAAAFVIHGRTWQPQPVARRKLGMLLGAGALTLLLYAPWLGAIFGELRGDRSYWKVRARAA